MSNALTSSFLQRKSATYRTLAELLIDQGRLVEAQQVLDLLKIQQYSDYVGEQPTQLGETLVRSPRESPLQGELEKQLAQWVSLDKAFERRRPPNTGKRPKFLRPEQPFIHEQVSFEAFLQNLYKQLEDTEGPAISVKIVTGAEIPLETLLARNPDAAALYTLEGADRYRVMSSAILVDSPVLIQFRRTHSTKNVDNSSILSAAGTPIQVLPLRIYLGSCSRQSKRIYKLWARKHSSGTWMARYAISQSQLC